MRLLLVDDHDVFREGLKAVLAASPDVTVVGEASHARPAFPLLETLRPDLVIMDLAMPGMDGASATREMRRRIPETRILVLTVHDARADVLDAFAAGAIGYALKSEPIEALLRAVQMVGRGERYIATSLAHLLAVRGRGADPNDALAPLSEREREVFRLASDGLMTSEIAHELCISRKTVDTHRYRIMKKLSLRNTAELIRFAAIHGLLRERRPRMIAAAVEGAQTTDALPVAPFEPAELGVGLG